MRCLIEVGLQVLVHGSGGSWWWLSCDWWWLSCGSGIENGKNAQMMVIVSHLYHWTKTVVVLSDKEEGYRLWFPARNREATCLVRGSVEKVRDGVNRVCTQWE